MDSVSVDATIASQITPTTPATVGRGTRASIREAIARLSKRLPEVTVGEIVAVIQEDAAAALGRARNRAYNPCSLPLSEVVDQKGGPRFDLLDSEDYEDYMEAM